MKVLRNCCFCLKTVFCYAPYRTMFAAICLMIPGCFMGVQVLLVQYIVDGAIAYIKFAAKLDGVIISGVILVVVMSLESTLQRLGLYQMGYTMTILTEKMTPDIVRHMEGLAYEMFEEKGVQEIFKKMTDTPEAPIGNCYMQIMMTIQSLVALIFSMAVIFSVSPWIGLGVLVIGIPMMALGYYAAGCQVRVTEELADTRRRLDDLKSLLTDKHAMYEMKLFGAEILLTEKWNYYSTKQADITMGENRKVMTVDVGSRILNVLYLLFVIGTAAAGLLGGNMTPGQFAGVLNCVRGVGGMLNSCSTFMLRMLGSAMEISFLEEFLHLKTRMDSGNIQALSYYDIAFENVSFRYPGTKRDVLKNVTFYVKEGERIAFVGENGAGKSTIIKLLCGLYEPDTGSVTVGGVSVGEMDPKLRTKLISVVFQDFQAYQMTLRENIAFGNQEAMEDDGKLMRALKQADAMELCDSHDKGLDRNLGKLTEDGQDLSAGQWQRVAMARAFVSDAKYVVLDEPTAALDPLAESHMYENFAKIFGERGTIMISHRLASAKMADRILVLDGGRIVQSGKHEELMSRQGLYRNMFLAQSSFYQESQENMPG